MIYEPEEDSFLLANEIKEYFKGLTKKERNIFKILDMGSGTGIQAITSIKSGAKRNNVLCIDINQESVDYLKKQNLHAIKSDLFSDIAKSKKFSLIIFNPPYLPEDKYDKNADTTSGKRGYELIVKFLKQAKQHLKNKGKIFLLFSSLSKPKIILNEAKKLDYKTEKLAEKNVGFFERLYVYSLRN